MGYPPTCPYYCTSKVVWAGASETYKGRLVWSTARYPCRILYYKELSASIILERKRDLQKFGSRTAEASEKSLQVNKHALICSTCCLSTHKSNNNNKQQSKSAQQEKSYRSGQQACIDVFVLICPTCCLEHYRQEQQQQQQQQPQTRTTTQAKRLFVSSACFMTGPIADDT